MILNVKETNNCEIVIAPKNAGDYGCFRIGGMSRTPKEEYYLCQDIIDNIKRHIDDIGYIGIKQETIYEFDGQEYDSIYDAMFSMFSSENTQERYWNIQGKRREDEQYPSSTYVYSFKELIEWAYENPYCFKIEYGEITEDEQRMLTEIVNWRIKLT